MPVSSICSVDTPGLTLAALAAALSQGPVFHTRGLCLTEIHQRVRTVVQSGGGGRPWFVTPEVVQIPETRATVTAILVLFGMPRLLTGSVLAHELMHAWIKLSSAG